LKLGGLKEKEVWGGKEEKPSRGRGMVLPEEGVFFRNSALLVLAKIRKEKERRV